MLLAYGTYCYGAVFFRAEEDDFVHCLGDQYTSCLTVDVLQSAGLSASDSYAYIGISYQLDYECTTGWDSKFSFQLSNAYGLTKLLFQSYRETGTA